MPVVSTPQDYFEEDLYIDLRTTMDTPLYLKCEGTNFGGSIKMKAAGEMVSELARNGRLTRDSILVESSSGNLGVALSVIAANRGYEFLCVTDTRCNPATLRLMRALGSRVHVITEPAPDGGLLGARLAYVHRLCSSDSRYVWTDQYTNAGNWKAHYHRTAPAIARRFPDLDVLFIATGTTGTLMGCARYLRDSGAATKIVAIDPVGSVTFGDTAAPRFIPGLGMGVTPPLLDRTYVADVVRVTEVEAVRTCRHLASKGFLLGGSTGAVVSGAQRWLAENDRSGGVTAVAISPDLGERYLDSIYDDTWVGAVWGPTALDPMRPSVAAVARR